MCLAFTLVLRVVAPSHVPRDYACASCGGSFGFVCVLLLACVLPTAVNDEKYEHRGFTGTGPTPIHL